MIMNISEVKNTEMNKGLAYALGLVYPLYKEKVLGGETYIIGCVNHNSGKVTNEQIAQHFQSVLHLFNESMGNALVLKTNKTTEYSISPKLGFSVLIKKGSCTTDESVAILENKVNEVKKASDEIKKEFVKGCFDGRSSWDTTAHYLSIDADRDNKKQDLIAEIIESLGISVNLNRRGEGHPKNDQIRIKPDSIRKYINDIGTYSTCRKQIIDNGLRTI